MSSVLNWPDYIVISIYLILTMVMGLWLGSRVKTGKDYFLGGRSLPWWAIGMSLVATDIGGTDIIGVGGAAYSHGLAVANFEWIGCVPAMIVGAFVFIPFFYRAGVYTIPEYFEARYSAGVRAIVALCWLLFMACNLGIMLLASAKMMSVIFGWDVTWCVGVTAVLVGTYTIFGGLAAVVYTDMLQCTVMIAGCLLILVLGIVEVGGIQELRDRIDRAEQTTQASDGDESRQASESSSNAEDTPLHHTQLLVPADAPTPFPWPGIIFGLAFILSPAYWIGNQAIVQRSLGARSEFEAKASYVWGALIKNIIPLIVAIPGLIALALVPDLKDGDLAIPSLVNQLLPTGIRGLFVAAFLAALMSSVDSYLNSSATIVSNDFYKRWINRSVTDERLLFVGRATTVALLGWAVFFAFYLTGLSEESGVYAIFQTLMAFFQGPTFAILLLGVLWKGARAEAAVVGLLAGIAAALSLYILNQPAVYQWLEWQPLFQIQEPFLYFSIWAFLVSAAITVFGSWTFALLRPQQSMAAESEVESPSEPAEELK